MRRKLTSILISLFMLFACVFTSACGDKYKNLEFSISYAFSQDSAEWTGVDLDEGIDLRYGEGEGLLKLINNEASLYLKIHIDNVEAKHVGRINVSKSNSSVSGLSFLSKQVEQDQVFEIKLRGMVNSSLVMYENNSGKKCSVNIKVSNSLESIAIDDSVLPTILLNNNDRTLDLDTINNIIYNPGDTYETGVRYELVSVGKYTAANNFVARAAVNDNIIKLDGENYITFNPENNVVKVENVDLFAENSCILKIKATSLVRECETIFDVYLVENQLLSPNVSFVNASEEVPVGSNEIYLYEGGEQSKYSSTTLKVSPQGINTVYANGVMTKDGAVIKYKPALYIDGEKYDFVKNDVNNKITIASGLYATNDEENVFKLTLLDRESATSEVSFRYELDKTAVSGDPTKINVNKSVLPTYIEVNNKAYKNGDHAEFEYYHFNDKSGYMMTISALPTKYNGRDVDTKEKIRIAQNVDYKIYKQDKETELTASNGYYEINSGDSICVKVVGNGGSNLVIETISTPEIYNGLTTITPEYISTSFKIKKIVTANNATFRQTKDGADIANNGNFIMAGEGEWTKLFIKATYDGNIENSSLTLVSNDGKVKFKNGQSSISFDELTASNIETHVGYNLYIVEVQTSSLGFKTGFSLIAGDVELATLNAEVVKALAPDSITLKSADAKDFDIIDDKYAFAGELNKWYNFEIYDGVKKITNGLTIKLSTTDNATFDYNQIVGSTFRAKGTDVGNQILTVELSYYSLTDGVLKLTNEDDIEINLAVYQPATGIRLTPSANSVAYINEKYTTSLTMGFEVLGIDSNTISFDGGATNRDIYELKFSMDSTKFNNFDISVDGIGSIVNEYKFDADKTKGTLKLGVKNELNYNSFELVFNLYAFDDTSVVQSARKEIAVDKVNRSTAVSFTGKDLDIEVVAGAEDNYSLNLSYLGVENKQVGKEFDIIVSHGNDEGIEVDDLVFELAKYVVDENGKAIGEPQVISSTSYLSLNYEDGHMMISANTQGGKYRLNVYAKDSWDKHLRKYTIGKSLEINVQDGTERYKYQINSKETFAGIYKDLKAYYELTDSFDLGVLDKVVGWGESGTAFEGGLDGQGYTIKYTMGGSVYKAVYDGYGDSVALFGMLGTSTKEAYIRNLNVDVTFDDIGSGASEGLVIAGLVGIVEANGKVEDVNVYVNGAVDATNGALITASNTVNFGGLAGINNGTITDSSVKYSKQLALNISQNAKIGGMVGKNAGSIKGKYEGKLDEIKYDVFADIDVKVNDYVYNIAGLAGNNAGTINNVLVSGKITANDNDITSPSLQSGYLAGIAGTTTGGISTAIALALDLTSDVLPIGGVAGESSAALDNVKFVSVKLEYDTNKFVYGKIIGNGANNVAGLVADNSGIIKYSSVESFVQESGFYTITGQEVYGLANGGTVNNSFVKANLSATNTLYVTASGATDSYFIGNINKADSGSDYKYAVINGKLNNTITVQTDITVEETDDDASEIYTAIKTYAWNNNFNPATEEGLKAIIAYTLQTYPDRYVLITGETDKYIPLSEKVEELLTSGLTDGELNEIISTLTIYQLQYSASAWDTISKGLVNDITNWATSYDKNYIVLNTSDKVHIYLPYIIKDGTPIMIIAPTDFDSYISQDKLEDIKSTYVEKELTLEDLSVQEFAIINYIKTSDQDSATFNTYSISELIDTTVYPEEASGGLNYQIVGGRMYANLNSNNEIIFLGESGDTPIIVRIYSLFNPELEKYVVFYTHCGLSKLLISSYEIQDSILGDVDYQMSLYAGTNAKILNFSAENTYEDNGKEKYATDIFHSSVLFDKGVLSIVNGTPVPCIGGESQLAIKVEGYDVSVSIKDGAVIPEGVYYEDITFSLVLDANYYGITGNGIVLSTTTLRVNLHNAATDIEVHADHYEMYTDSNLTANVTLETGFFHKEGEATTDVQGYEDLRFNTNEPVHVEFNEYSDRDGLIIGLECVDNYDEFVRMLGKAIDIKDAIKIFEFTVYRDLYIVGEDQKGFNYNIQAQLVDEFNIRYIESDIELRFKLTAWSNNNVYTYVSFTLKPAQLNTVRINNYPVDRFDPYSAYQNIVTNENIETSIIEPGSAGAIMAIYIEPAYADVDRIVLSSSRLEGNNNIFLKYTQYIYDKDRSNPMGGFGAYVSYYGGDKPYQDSETTEIELKKVSERRLVDGKYVETYTGVIYVYVKLDKIIGQDPTVITANLKLYQETADSEYTLIRDLDKPLLTEYLPGVDISYNTGDIDVNAIKYLNGYQIQKGTSKNVIDLRVFGYKFNANPTPNLKWYLPDGTTLSANFEIVSDIDSNEEFLQALDENGELWTQEGYKYSRATSYESGKIYYKFTGGTTLTTGDGIYNITNYVNTYLITDYDDVVPNPSDGSHSLQIGFNVAKDIPAAFSIGASMSLTMKDGSLTQEESEDIVFFPTDYIIDKISINTNNGEFMLAVGASKYMEFKFSTLGDGISNDYTSELLKMLIESYITGGVFNSREFFSLFTYDDNGVEKNFVDKTYINAERSGNRIVVKGNGPIETSANFAINYYFKMNEDSGTVSLKFGSAQNGETNVVKDFDYILEIYSADTEENAMPIYTASDMFNSDGSSALAKGAHYILMNDIDLTDMTIMPIDTEIGSLDGNNKIIKIGRFYVDNSKPQGNFGLFAKIGTYSLGGDNDTLFTTSLKNVIVDYSEFDENGLILGGSEENHITTVKFGGLVGENNGGIIYNCDVVNTDIAQKKVVNVVPYGANDVTVYFGGLVGTNSGSITNSRVGRESYEKITPTLTGLSRTEAFGTLSFVVGDNSQNNEDKNGFNVFAGGLVGDNTNIISNSYVARTDLFNYSTLTNDSSLDNSAQSQNNNKTAGFAGQNSGTIKFSYVRGLRDSGTYYTGSSIETKGESSGSVAGFVYNNTGIVDNCYANIKIHSDSALVSGFVFNNASGAVVSSSYAACDIDYVNSQDSRPQPFVGVNNEGTSLSKGTLENTYYLLNDYNSNVSSVSTGFNAENFAESSNLNGFTFVLSTSSLERSQGIWSYYSIDGAKHNLPILISAETIAHSCKFLDMNDGGVTEDENGKKQYNYTEVAEYYAGSAKNPHIIRDYADYNKVLLPNENKSFVGYVRMVNDITFDELNVPNTRQQSYTLGNSEAVTSIDGNGMTIRDIRLIVEDNETNGSDFVKMGLFNTIENAYVKNLNLVFTRTADDKSEVDQGNITNTTKANIVGGLAGDIKDSIIINISLDSNGLIFAGNNMVGGLAGRILGQSFIYGIDSNVGVKVSNNHSAMTPTFGIYKASETPAKMMLTTSFGGSIAGVIDLEPRALLNNEFNLSNINIYGDRMAEERDEELGGEYAINADYAGSVAGYANAHTKVFRAKYYTGSDETIRGSRAVGGLFGVFLGEMTASQVTMEEGLSVVGESIYDHSNQYEIDIAFAEYAKQLNTNNSTVLAKDSRYGNMSLLESNGYAGGLVGVGAGSLIHASYSKASINSGKIVGGLIGADIASTITYSYAVPYINITANTMFVGGLIGMSYGDSNDNYVDSISDYRTYANLSGNLATSLQYTFSTVMMENIAYSATVDYIANKASNVGATPLTINRYVYYGDMLYDTNPTNTTLAERKEMYLLCDLDSSEHETIFQDIFSTWEGIRYWHLDSSRFYPLLLDTQANNYIRIRTYEDFEQLAANPDGAFKVIDNIRFPDTLEASNWIVNITNGFRGILIGDLPNTDVSPKIYINKLTPNTPNESVGFFNATNGAVISNLDFIWGVSGNANAIDLTSGHTYTKLSTLSCDDTGSTFTNINVSVASTQLTDDETSINEFGGIVGSASSTNIVNCTFAGSVSATLANDGDNAPSFGGLIGTAKRSEDESLDGEGSFIYQDAMSITNSAVGTEKKNATFTIKIESEARGANIGGFIGKSNDTSISGASVANTTYTENKTITMNIEDKSTESHIYIGGLVGQSTNTAIVSSKSSAKLSLTGNNSNYHIGGIAAKASYDALGTGIRGCTANVIFTESSGTADTINYGGIVAIAENANIQQVIALGQVDFNELTANNITAGGILAEGVGNILIREAMNNVVMTKLATTGEENHIKLGGLVGVNSGNLEIIHSMSSGRIAPETNGNYGSMAIGGLVGLNETSKILTIKNTIALTTLLTDGLNANFVMKLYDGSLSRVNALVGEDKNVESTTTQKVYYSSDIILATETHHQYNDIINYTASVMTNNYNSWTNELNNENGNAVQVWTTVENSMPHISSLKTGLQLNNVLSGDSYQSGTAMKPKFTVETSGYYYYLIKDSTKLGQFADNNWSGVLIGADEKFSLVNGLSLNSIEQHSAVSNVHIQVTGDAGNVDASGNYGFIGFIVDTNNGVVYNSSVQGTGLNISGGSYLGIIAQNNQGMVMNTYSTIEILNTSAYVGGIVQHNSGKVVSSYFTGYINSNSNSAGLVHSNVDDNSYIYNNYMAGVITNFDSDNVNSAFGFGITNDNGSFNYIDSLANPQSKAERLSGFSNSNSLDIVKADGLVGPWYTIKGNAKVMEGEQEIELSGLMASSELFGKNYNYPVFKLNRWSGDKNLDLNYQLSTGTGVSSESGIDSLSARKEKVLTDDTEYENAFKIPHLGVLKQVEQIINDNSCYTPEGGEKTILENYFDRNYVLIYDVDGQTEWEISLDNIIGFTGVFTSNKNLARNNVASECVIKNIQFKSTGYGLFSRIRNAYISNIRFDETFKNIEDAGLIAGSVEGTANADKLNVIIDKITFGEDLIITGLNKEQTVMGGLFGSIAGNLKIKNLDLTAHLDNGSVVGLIAGKIIKEKYIENILADHKLYVEDMYYPNIVFDEGSTREISVHMKGIKYAGGLFGLVAGGTISTNSSGETINLIANESVDDTNIVYGGLIGKTGQIYGEQLSSDHPLVVNGKFTIKFSGNQRFLIMSENFGGVIGEVGQTEVQLDQIILEIENAHKALDTKVALSNDNNRKYDYGMLTARSGADISINEFTFKNILSVNVQADGILGKNIDLDEVETMTNTSVGLFIGRQGGDLLVKKLIQEGLKDEEMINLLVSGIANLGGISGIYESGSIAIENTVKGYPSVGVIGQYNVGGIFGRLDKKLTDTLDVGTNKILENEWALIGVNGRAKNVGGLFGLVSQALGTSPEDEADLAGETEITELTNNNSILILYASSNALIDAYNIGGIAGRYMAKYSNMKLTNKGSIIYQEGLSVVENGEDRKNVSIISGADVKDVGKKYITQAINVGGVFGRVGGDEKTTISNIYNEGTVQGYQNVGSLIGNIYNTEITGDLTDTIEIVTTNTDYGKLNNVEDITTSGEVLGVLNVGGMIGFAEDSKITNAAVSTKVEGNSNVGGLVGFTSNTIINNVFVGGKSNNDTDTMVVNAIYYKLYDIIKGEIKDSFFPSNVGGFIGANINPEGTALIDNVIIYNVKVTSAGESAGEEGKTINLVSNLMHKLQIETIERKSLYGQDIGENASARFNFNSASKVKFDDHIGGFGGFIGYSDILHEEKIYMYDVNVSAELGVNVGTFYGYNSIESIESLVSTPFLYSKGLTDDDVYIDIEGSYNIGGFIGKYNDKTNNAISNELSFAQVRGNATIRLQNTIKGINVGSIFGELNSSNVVHLVVSNVDSAVDIKIKTDNTYYAGGVVGKLVLDDTIGTGQIFKATVINKDLVDGNEAQNFGGLVGILKTKIKTNKISGSHKYPFTVNTIENEGYVDGQSTFEVGEDRSSLNAMAMYINTDNFDIVGSGEESLYDNVAVNPLNANAIGWSKKYTGFRIIQRRIIQPGVDWDAVAILYDAANITHVGTIGNLSLTDTYLPGSSVEWERSKYLARGGLPEGYYLTGLDAQGKGVIAKPETTDTDYEKKIKLYNQLNIIGYDGSNYMYHPDYICFTVYEQGESLTTLYSAIGSASLMKDLDENSDKLYETLTDKTAGLKEWLTSIFVTSEPPDQLYYIDAYNLANNLKGLTYFNYAYKEGPDTNLEEYKTIGGTDTSLQYEDNKVKRLAYFIPNYLNTSSELAAEYDGSQYGAYFAFDVVYDNESLNGVKGSTKDGDITLGGLSDDYLPRSGCIFDISGTHTTTSDRVLLNEDEFNWFGFWLTVLEVTVDVIIVACTFGAGSAIVSAKMAAKYAAKSAAKAAIKAFTKRIGRNIAKKGIKAFLKKAAVAAAAMLLINTNLSAQRQAESEMNMLAMYNKASDTSYGFLSSVYDRDISFKKEGSKYILNDSTDSWYSDDNGSYRYYSNSRPTDYHTVQYIGLAVAGEMSGEVFTAIEAGDDATWTWLPYSNKELRNIGTYTYKETDETSELMGQTITGQWCLLAPKYAYYNGKYYIHTNAGKVNLVETTLEFKPEIYLNKSNMTVNREEPTYTYYNNAVYVHGTYANGGYVYENDYPGNNLKYDGQYKIRDNVIDESKAKTNQVKYKYIPTDPVTYNNIVSANYATGYGPIKGYDYFDGIYYSPKGKNVDGATNKYAEYVYYDGSISGLKENYDYIVVQTISYSTSADGDWYYTGSEYKAINYCNEYGELCNKADAYATHYIDTTGNPQLLTSITRYTRTISNQNYKLTGFSSETTATSLPVSAGTTKVVVEVKPDTFRNPYSGGTNLWSTDYVWAYTPQNNLNSRQYLEFNPDYYTYDGGYIVDDDAVSIANDGGYPMVYTPVADSDLGLKITVATTIYDGRDISETQATEGDEKTLRELIAAKDTYFAKPGEWYIIESEQILTDVYKVDEDGKLYVQNLNYTLNSDGKLCRVMVTYDQDPNVNIYEGMYLSNAGYKFYTRYKYTYDNSKVDFLDMSKIRASAIEILPKTESDGVINLGRHTRFIEGLKVVLSGSQSIKKGSDGSTVKSGNIVVY